MREEDIQFNATGDLNIQLVQSFAYVSKELTSVKYLRIICFNRCKLPDDPLKHG